MLKIAVLMTCHNRKEKTLACLKSLYDNVIPDGYLLEVFLVDDGSIDGTADGVMEKYPDVKIICGNGNLYWSGGMRLAWSVAAKNNFDYYIWLNDDVLLFENSLRALLISALNTKNSAIICSAMISESLDQITYGGTMKGSKKTHVPDGTLSECQIINGNCVIIPKFVFDVIGNIDKIFHHGIGDHDYGLRAIEAGLKCYVAPDVIGICNSNTLPPKWLSNKYSFIQRVKFLYSPLRKSYPVVYFIYVRRHFGLFQAVKQFIFIHIRVVFLNFF